MRKSLATCLRLILFLSGAVTAFAQVRLVAELDGRRLPIAKIQGERAWVDRGDGSSGEVSIEEIRVEGNLGPSMNLIWWGPDYSIIRSNESSLRRNPAPYVAQIHLTRLEPKFYGELPVSKRSLLDVWPLAFEEESLAIVIWVVDGQIELAKLRVMPGGDVRPFAAREVFYLGENQRRGQAAVLWWQNGQFLEARTTEWIPEARELIPEMMVGDVSALAGLLNSGFDPDTAVDSDRNTLMHYAAEAGAADAVELLLRAGAEPTPVNVRRNSPMHGAAAKGREELARKLTSAKGYIRVVNMNEETPMNWAAKAGHIEIMKILSDANSFFAVLAANRETVLSVSVDGGYTDQVELIVPVLQSSKGTNVRSGLYGIDFESEKAAEILVQQARKGHASMVKLLLALGVRHDVGGLEMSALQAAALSGDVRSIELLLSAGAKPDATERLPMTPLAISVSRGHYECVSVLLRAGANVDWRDERGNGLLHFAAAADDAKIATLLMEHGIDRSRTNDVRVSPLEAALLAGGGAVADAIVAAGERLSADSPGIAGIVDGVLRLDYAALLSDLLEQGLDPHLEVRPGWHQVEVARIYRAKACIAILEPFAARGAPLGFSPAAIVSAEPRVARAALPPDPRNPGEETPETTVRVDLVVSDQGGVLFPKIVEPVDPRLRLATLRAVSQWRFSPALSGDRPVHRQVRIPVVYPSSRDRVYTLEQVDRPPKVISRTLPRYPNVGRTNFPAGPVNIRVVINSLGVPEAIGVTDEAHVNLEAAAIEAVSKWRFEPAVREGQSVSVRLTFPVEFVVP